MPTSIRSTCFLLLFVVLLTASFGGNLLGVADHAKFQYFQSDTEGHVIGRLVIARSHGLLSFGGLTGVAIPQARPYRLERGWPAGQAGAQYAAFLSGDGFDFYDPYLSQPGWQALGFSVLDRVLPISNQAKLSTFRWLSAGLTALVLACALLWIRLEMGIVAGVLAGVSLLSSQWLCLFGRNLWWSTWSFYLPMVALMWLLRRRSVRDCKYWVMGAVVLGTMLMKCLATGFEYMTTACIMLTVPLAYCQVRHWPGLARVGLQWTTTVTAAVLAAVVGMGILTLQIGCVTGDLSSGVAHLRHSLLKRSHGRPDEFPSYRRGLDADIMDVFHLYHRGVFTSSDHLPFLRRPAEADGPGRRAARREGILVVRYLDLVRLFGGASVLAVVLLGLPRAFVSKRVVGAALLATWLSLLAPYSWFVIFKGHSSIHQHMNYIVWQMPFTIFGFAMVGVVLSQLSTALYRVGTVLRKRARRAVVSGHGQARGKYSRWGRLGRGGVLGLLLPCLLLMGCGGVRPSALDASSVVLAFGDSLTFGTGATVDGGYPALLAGLLECEVVNAGVPGERSGEGRARLPAVLARVAPDLVILCHGGNDMLAQQDDAATQKNLAAMIEACQAAGAEVVLVAVPRPSLLLRPPRFYRELAKSHRVPLEASVLHDVLSSPALKSDRIHPNDAGYAQMAEVIAQLIEGP